MESFNKIFALCEHEFTPYFREMFINPILSADVTMVSSRSEWQYVTAEIASGLRKPDIFNDYTTYSHWSQFFLSFSTSIEFNSWSQRSRELIFLVFHAVQLRYSCQIKPASWSLDAFRGDERYSRPVSVPERTLYWLFNNFCCTSGTLLYNQMRANPSRAKEGFEFKNTILSSLLRDLNVLRHNINLFQSYHTNEWDSPFYIKVRESSYFVMIPSLLLDSYPNLSNVIHCNYNASDALYGVGGYHSSDPSGLRRNKRTRELAKESSARARLKKELGLLPSKNS